MDFRKKMVAAVSQKCKNEDDEDDLEALRLAALQTLRAKDTLQNKRRPQHQVRGGSYKGSQSLRPYYNQSRSEHFSHRQQRLNGVRNNYFPKNSYRNPNLIEIVPVGEVSATLLKENVDAQSSQCSSDGSKFQRYNDNASGSDDDDVKDIDRKVEVKTEEKEFTENEEVLTDKENESGVEEGSQERTAEEEEEERLLNDDDDDVLLMADLEEEDSLERLMDEMEREIKDDKIDITEKKPTKKEKSELKKIRELSKSQVESEVKDKSSGKNKTELPVVSKTPASSDKQEPRPPSPRPNSRRRSSSPKPRPWRKSSPRRSPPRRSPARRSPVRMLKNPLREMPRYRSPRKSPPRYSSRSPRMSPRPRSPRLSPRRSPNRSPIRRSPLRKLSPRGRSPRLSPRSRSPRLWSRSPRSRSRSPRPLRSPRRLRSRSPRYSPLRYSPRPRTRSPQSRSPRSPRRRISRSRSPRSPRRGSSRLRSPRMSPRRISPRYRSPRGSPRRSPWSSPRRSPRISPKRAWSPKWSPKDGPRKLRIKSNTPEKQSSSPHKKDLSPSEKSKSPETTKIKPKQRETVPEKPPVVEAPKQPEPHPDPILEARRRKFESSTPIDPINANKKIKLSSKKEEPKKPEIRKAEGKKSEPMEGRQDSVHKERKVTVATSEYNEQEDLLLDTVYEFEESEEGEEGEEEEAGEPVANSIEICSELETVTHERKRRRKKDKEIYQVGKLKNDIPLSERVIKEKKIKKRKVETVVEGSSEVETVVEEMTVDEEGDLRTELSRRRAERLNRNVPMHSARLLQSAFKGVVNEVAKNNAKVNKRHLIKEEEKPAQKEVRRVTVLHRTLTDFHDSEDDTKVPVRLRLGINKEVLRKSKRQGRKD